MELVARALMVTVLCQVVAACSLLRSGERMGERLEYLEAVFTTEPPELGMAKLSGTWRFVLTYDFGQDHPEECSKDKKRKWKEVYGFIGGQHSKVVDGLEAFPKGLFQSDPGEVIPSDYPANNTVEPLPFMYVREEKLFELLGSSLGIGCFQLTALRANDQILLSAAGYYRDFQSGEQLVREVQGHIDSAIALMSAGGGSNEAKRGLQLVRAARGAMNANGKQGHCWSPRFNVAFGSDVEEGMLQKGLEGYIEVDRGPVRIPVASLMLGPWISTPVLQQAEGDEKYLPFFRLSVALVADTSELALVGTVVDTRSNVQLGTFLAFQESKKRQDDPVGCRN